MPAMQVTDKDFEEKVLKADKPVLVDFFATWCGPCQMAAPVIDELAEEYKDKMLIVKLDVDQNHETAGKYSVMSIPTMIAFKGGQEAERVSGFGGKEGVLNLIKKVLGEN